MHFFRRLLAHRLTRWIAGIVISLFIIFTLIGALASPDFEGRITHTFNAPVEVVWNIITDIDGLPSRRKEIVRVEPLTPSVEGYDRWKEYTDLGGYALFEKTNEKLHTQLVLEMVESSFGMSGVWTYTFEAKRDTTTITITEKSHIDKLYTRAILTLAGRDANLKREVELLEQFIK